MKWLWLLGMVSFMILSLFWAFQSEYDRACYNSMWMFFCDYNYDKME